MANDCPRFGKLFRGCNFAPRYDEVKQRREVGMASDFWWETTTPTSSKTIMRPQVPTDKITYVRDVCTRCGRTVERRP